jgi:predicted P-loop ATPase
MDTWLTDYAGCEQSKYSTEVGRYILLAMVKRVFHPGCKADYMPILEGGQGSGKSTLCAILGGYWSSDEDPFAIPNPRDRATILEGKWVVEIPELSSFARSHPNQLKSFITKTHDRIRRAWGREVENLGRTCVFIGTTNDDFYLLDKTGNRRFLPLALGSVRIPEFRAVRDQLLAEAMVEYRKHGDKTDLTFSKDVEDEAAKIQESRRVVSAFEEDLTEYIDYQVEKGSQFISIDEIKRHMRINHKNRVVSSQVVNRYFQRIGWAKTRQRTGEGRCHGYGPSLK